MAVEPTKTREIFYSYAHEDEELRNQLERHLSVLKRQGLISSWHDRLIDAGNDWEREIDAHLNTAHIILLLVSADFMFSEYCYSIEMERALERHDAGEARVIPIILRAVVWQNGPFGKLQALPTGGRPITSWPDRDEAFTDVVQGIRRVIETPSTGTLPKIARLSALNQPDVIQVSAVQDPWSSLGSTGVLIGMYTHAQQWERAEQAVGSIGDSRQRALAQRMLVNELGKARQWVRAETVARSIEVRSERVDAFCDLVGELSDAREWVRAETVVYSIEYSPNKFQAMNQLSDALARAGEWGRASALLARAGEWDRASVLEPTPVSPPKYQSTPQYQQVPSYPGLANPIAPSGVPRPGKKAFPRLSWIVAALALAIGIVGLIVAALSPGGSLTPMLYVVSSIMVGVVVIVGITAFIRRRY